MQQDIEGGVMHIGELFIADVLDWGEELEVDDNYLDRQEAIQMINHVMRLFEIDKGELTNED